MLTRLERLLRRQNGKRAAGPLQPADPSFGLNLLENAHGDDIEIFLVAARHAAALGQAPWILRDRAHLDTLGRALAFTLQYGLWLQRNDMGVEHWQGQLLALRPSGAPPIGLVLACRPDDEAAWQLRFFCIDTPWLGKGYGARLLRAARRSLSGVPLHARLPLCCVAAVKSLEAAGFQRMHVDATDIASFEAPAEWD
ncbi:hypothetical protein SAMN02745148_02456 [Modicisalibacter ilicicola DSM 19980]|uniref:N-acetyltransferase domain-containing protein n=1 Tax=Modicisalibacter ilicicola DSM 19980 TaxID=1121942 RepID=A0A1M5B3D2_9GAMM|nr:GNAT family N-acetyltransferase [Halomonas ilicicola]SHF37071.1 hypothetical protein SAMN02745148_02456 [Halomonas ilicicola DSM 19980]